MDIPDCSTHHEASKKDKLTNSYIMAVDSGYDSIYSSCSSVLMEKSFSRESFDIFSPNSANRTPTKQSSAPMKYHISTPKSTAAHKRHLYKSFNTSSLKRSKSEKENEENESKTANAIIHKKPDHLNDSGYPLRPLHNYDFSFTPKKGILSSTAKISSLLFINKSSFSDSKQSRECDEECNDQQAPSIPERPTKILRYFHPTIKHSKRKLDIPQEDGKDKQNRIFFNGTRFLNILGKLAPFNEVLDSIFKNLSSKDLLNVSLVSKNWNSIVKSNRNANTRLKQYLNESRNVKENLREPAKPVIKQHTKRHPFSQSNIMSTSKKKHSSLDESNFSGNQSIVHQLFGNERLVKCPRCSRSSIISNSSVRLHSTSLISEPLSTTSRDLTFLNETAASICGINATDISIDNDDQSRVTEDFGICTSVACQYKFCPKCFGDFHPGKRCITSDPESPSKLIICHQKLKIKTKPNSKRQSLRRLCFS